MGVWGVHGVRVIRFGAWRRHIGLEVWILDIRVGLLKTLKSHGMKILDEYF